jgi:type II secretory pathway component GspD/PulD (secretin)
MVQDMRMNKALFFGSGRWLMALLILGATAGSVMAAGPNHTPATPAAVTNDKTVDPCDIQYDAAKGVVTFMAFTKGMTIRQGLNLLGTKSQKNIVPSSGVDVPVPVSKLYNVTFEQALQAILGNGFKYEIEGQFVRVYTTEEFKKKMEDPTRMEEKVITLYYVTADEVSKLIKPVLSLAGKTVATTPAKKTMTSVSTSTSGDSSSGGSSGGSLGGEGSGDTLALNDMLVIVDYPENIAKAEAIIRKVDVRPKQVLVEATILSATLNESMQFGIDWNLLSGVPVNVGTGGIASTSNMTNNGVPVSPFPANILGGQGTAAQTSGFASPGNGLTVGFSAGNVQAIITALEGITDVTLMANPKILAVNKQEGVVQIGKTIGYRGSTTIGQGGIATQGDVQFMPTGTVLVFRPFIGDDGYIRMDIYPQDSTGAINPATSVPDKTTAELRTNIIVKDGETIVIGGLFRDQTSKSKNQVPILGNLPLVGALFRSSLDVTTRQEVIIMLTPHIINEPAETHAKERLNDIRLKHEGAKNSLEAIDTARIAEDAYARAAKYYLEGEMEKALFNLRIALTVRPTYLEALRLRERIIAETDPEQFKKIDTVAEQEVEKQEAPVWSRN